MNNHWSTNTPARFWICQDEIPTDNWQMAIQKALPTLGLIPEPVDVEDLLTMVLGEAQFGARHWQLSPAKRMYYMLKPLLPSQLRYFLRQLQSPSAQIKFSLGWPIEKRYARFQWEVMRQLLTITGQSSLEYRQIWPDGSRFAFVLTHDIETEDGQAFVREVADLEEDLGFRSSFNFVPERYPLDLELMEELRERGFEIGVHGLRHDGKLFRSREAFLQRAESINKYLKEFEAVGFRAPLMHRNPDWMQALEVDYDLSFFDTDPYEPIPGGCMSIWPFRLGHFIELPYTLVQDSTLRMVLNEGTPRLWLEKLDFLEHYRGMALVNTHPDYLKEPVLLKIYIDFLKTVSEKRDYWHALPREVARWWRVRAGILDDGFLGRIRLGRIVLEDNHIIIS
jgi:peptidoglycan/xylan/chitin deacetylase (PgdA/CDA1 family)